MQQPRPSSGSSSSYSFAPAQAAGYGSPSGQPRTPSQAPPAKRLRILLVEDHLDTRLVMESLLRRDQHTVRGVASGEEAFRWADLEPFDLVISDLGLPDITGLELMTQLRERHGLRGIAVSGYGMQEDIARSRLAGFEHHLTKPIRLDLLRAMIAEMRPADED